MKLSEVVTSKVLRALVKVARGDYPNTNRKKLVSYKELWALTGAWGPMPPVFGQGHAQKMVPYLLEVSRRELIEGRPPLNELVVCKKNGRPGYAWPGLRSHLEVISGVSLTYRSHKQAQKGCWMHWSHR